MTVYYANNWTSKTVLKLPTTIGKSYLDIDIEDAKTA
jgi:hypothetical protein